LQKVICLLAIADLALKEAQQHGAEGSNQRGWRSRIRSLIAFHPVIQSYDRPLGQVDLLQLRFHRVP
jgi:hypothetical protein